MFEDHFNGTTLDTTNVWEPFWYSEGQTLNNVAVHASNVSVSGGNLVLDLPSSTSGSCVTTRPSGSRAGFKLGRPCVWEAYVKFPGDGTSLYNWPAFWVLNDAAGQQNVEVDIAEVWDGVMQENYHCGTSNPSFNYPSYVGGSFHKFTLHRKTTGYDLYVDGALIHTVTKDAADDGLPQYVMFNNGRTTSGNHNAFGTTGRVLVDYVRAWAPPVNRPTNPLLINLAETWDPNVVTQDPALWAHPGALVVAGLTNYNDPWIHTIANAGATVLLYFNAFDMYFDGVGGGPYTNMFFQASEYGPAIPRWPGDIKSYQFPDGSWVYMADIRTAADGGGILQAKLPGVLQRVLSDNPHLSGFFMDVLGTYAWNLEIDFSTWTATEKAKYRRGAVAIAQTCRTLADAHNLFIIANGTWLKDPQGGGYPDTTQHGCSLVDGGCAENQPYDTFWEGYLNAAQWGQATPRKLPYGLGIKNANDTAYTNAWKTHCAYAQYGVYAGGTPAPWGGFTDFRLPRRP